MPNLAELRSPAGAPRLVSDMALNDSDKSFTVPTGRVYDISSIWAELTTTATAGLRQLVVQFQDDSSNIISEMVPAITQDTGLTHAYIFGLGLTDLKTLRDGYFLMTPIPPIVLPPNYVVRVFENNAVDPAADDLMIRMIVAERYHASAGV